MPLVPMSALVDRAQQAAAGIGAFNVIQLEHAEAIIEGAESAARPVILQISQNTAAFHRGLAPLGRAVLQIAADAAVPCVVHLDHGHRRRAR